jgi:hypothetical protein
MVIVVTPEATPVHRVAGIPPPIYEFLLYAVRAMIIFSG